MTRTIRRKGRVGASWLRLALGLAAAIAATGFGSRSGALDPSGPAAYRVPGSSGRDPGSAQLGPASMAHVAGGDGRAVSDLKQLSPRTGRRLLLVRRREASPGPAAPALQSHPHFQRTRLRAFLRHPEAVGEVNHDENGSCSNVPDGVRALFDLAVTVTAARLLQSVHSDRMGSAPGRLYNYDVTSQQHEAFAAELHSARDGARIARRPGRRRAPDAPVYVRMVKALSDLPGAGRRGPLPGRPGPRRGTEEEVSAGTEPGPSVPALRGATCTPSMTCPPAPRRRRPRPTGHRSWRALRSMRLKSFQRVRDLEANEVHWTSNGCPGPEHAGVEPRPPSSSWRSNASAALPEMRREPAAA